MRLGKIAILLLCLLQGPKLYGQKIDRAEYFWDSDPGVGNGTAISFGGSKDTLDISQKINYGTLTGRHYLYIRVRSTTKKWSIYHFQAVVIIDTTKINRHKLVGGEYFFDADTGVGKSTPISFSARDTINSTLSIKKNLSVGSHTFYARYKNQNGKWSPYHTQRFIISDSSNKRLQIQQIEYFIGQDSGVGRGQNIAFTKSDTVTKLTPCNTQKLTPGYYYVSARAKSNNRLWSPYHFGTFRVTDSSSSNKRISKIEYIFNKDTAVGKAIQISFTKKDTVEITLNTDSKKLPKGWNKIAVRASTPNKVYSTQNWVAFLVQDSTRRNKPIAELQYALDNYTSGTVNGKISYNPGIDSIKSFNLKIDSATSLGRHFEYARFKSYLNFPGTWHKDTFTIINCPMMDTAQFTMSSAVCRNDSVLLTQKITNFGSWPADTFNFNWDIGNNGSVESTKASYKHKFTTAGNIAVKLSFTKKSDSRCKGQIVKNIVVGKIANDTFTKQICNGDSFKFNGITRKTSGIYKDTLKTVIGCDSFVFCNLAVNPTYSGTIAKSICNGDSILFAGVWRKSNGTFTQSLKTTKGCDSIIKLTLTVNPKYFKKDTFTICANDTLKIHGKKYRIAGLYTDTFKTKKGCDSIFLTLLKVNPSYKISIAKGLCAGDSIFFDGKFRKTTGVYTGNFKTTKNCDSIVILNLQIEAKIVMNQKKEICRDDSIFLQKKFRKTAGLYFDTFKAVKGCDSLVITQLQINQPAVTNLNQTICFNSSFIFDGKLLTASGNYTQHLKTYKGCDSTVVLKLTVLPESKGFDTIRICSGDSVFLANGFRSIAGNYVETIKNKAGCDSVIQTTLIVQPPYFNVVNAQICLGTKYRMAGKDYSTPGNYTLRFKSVGGCDSVVLLKLKVLKQLFTQSTFELCEGDSITLGNRKIKKGGIYTDTFIAQGGCDSVVQNIVIGLKKIEYISKDTFCSGDSLVIGGKFVSKSGTYTDRFISASGCDSIIHYELYFRAALGVKVVSAGFNQLSTNLPFSTYQWFRNNLIMPGETNRTLNITKSGIYDVTVTDSIGCRASTLDDNFLQQRSISRNPSVHVYPNPTENTLYIAFEEMQTGAVQYAFTNSAGSLVKQGVLLANENKLDLSPFAAGVYQLTILSRNNIWVSKILVVK